MLAEDNLVLSKVFLWDVSFEWLHGDLVLKKFFCGSLKPLLFDGAWNVAFVKNTSWDKDIVIDSVIHFACAVVLQQRPPEIVFVFFPIFVCWDRCSLVYIDHCRLSDHVSSTLTDHRAQTIYCFLPTFVTLNIAVPLLKLLNSLYQFSLSDRTPKLLRWWNYRVVLILALICFVTVDWW